jgi:hypothetical protein
MLAPAGCRLLCGSFAQSLIALHPQIFVHENIPHPHREAVVDQRVGNADITIGGSVKHRSIVVPTRRRIYPGASLEKLTERVAIIAMHRQLECNHVITIRVADRVWPTQTQADTFVYQPQHCLEVFRRNRAFHFNIPGIIK